MKKLIGPVLALILGGCAAITPASSIPPSPAVPVFSAVAPPQASETNFVSVKRVLVPPMSAEQVVNAANPSAFLLLNPLDVGRARQICRSFVGVPQIADYGSLAIDTVPVALWWPLTADVPNLNCQRMVQNYNPAIATIIRNQIPQPQRASVTLNRHWLVVFEPKTEAGTRKPPIVVPLFGLSSNELNSVMLEWTEAVQGRPIPWVFPEDLVAAIDALPWGCRFFAITWAEGQFSREGRYPGREQLMLTLQSGFGPMICKAAMEQLSQLAGG